MKKSNNITLECFLDIEMELKLFDRQINNYYFWMYLRHPIIDDTIQITSNRGVGHNISKIGNTKKEKVINLIKLIKNYITYIYKYIFMKKKKVLIINHPRKVKDEEGLYECKYTDVISNYIQDSTVIEFPYPCKHYYPAKNKKILYMDFVKITAHILSKILRKTKKNKELLEYANKNITEIDEKIQEKIGIKINKNKYVNRIIEYYYIYVIEKKLLKKLIKKIQPEKIVEVVYYATDNMIINEIAKELNIEIIELQHGTIGNEHIAYNFKEKINIPQFPEKILLFSNYWKETARFPIDEKKLIPVGFPYFENQVEKVQKNKKDNQKRILFISQGTIGYKLVKLAVDLEKLITENEKMNKEYEIIYKLHPGEFKIWKEEYSQLINSNIKVITNEIDLYELFFISDIQIGVYSTAIYEGLGFNLHTLIYKIIGSGVFEDLCNKGYTKYINNADEIIDYIENIKNSKINSEEFWKKDSLNNILKEINK